MSLILSGTDGLSDVDGSASTPAIRGTDTNTGIFFPAADTIAFAEGGAEVARLDSSGNVLVGQTSMPAGWGVTPRLSLKQSQTGAGAGVVVLSSSNDNTIYLGYDSFNSVGKLGVSYGSTGSYTPLTVEVGGSERMRITSSGQLLINGTANFQDAKLEVNGDGTNTALAVKQSTTSSRTQISFNNPNGVVGQVSTSGSSTSYVTSSDYRLKENIAPMTGALATVAQLKPVTYTWKHDGSASQGFIAHELQEVVPDAVVGEKDAVNEDGTIKAQGIDTSFLVATLTAAIQEQQAIITDLKSRIEALEAK
jgi:hypothetical protein